MEKNSMTKEQAEKYAEELKRFIGETSEGCSCEIHTFIDTADVAIVVAPGEDNFTKTLYHTTEIVDFCRGHKLDFWISADLGNGKPYPYAYIF